MNFFKTLSVKARLSLVVGITITLITVMLMFLGKNLYSQRDRDFQAAYTQATIDLLKALGENERAGMQSNFKALTRNRKLSSALFRGTLDKIQDAIGPTATRLQAMGVADNLVIVTRDGKLGFSALSAVTQVGALAQQAIQSGKQISGLELTADGRLINAVAIPILDRADLVGVGVFEKNIQGLLENLKSANGHEYAAVGDDGRVLAATSEDMPGFEQAPAGENSYWETNFTDRVLGVASLPLTDAFDKPIAMLHSTEDVTEAVAMRRNLWIMEIGLSIGMLMLAVFGISYLMGRMLSPLNDCISHMERIAGGDLSAEISCKRQDDFRRLMESMRTMNDDLRSLVGKVAGISNEVITTVGQVQTASQQTDQHVAEQRSGLEQLATALTQMAATANEVTRNISQLASSADESLAATNEGDSMVKSSVKNIEALTDRIREGGETVRDLKEKSERIGVVVEVIKSIAEQTNLLALNAAIEAARAGEQGRGFAVVADEVRTLAARTQDSTAEIADIIGGVQTGVSQAANVIDQSVDQAVEVSSQAATISEALESIHAQMSTITDLSSQVATASEQQRATTEDMSQNVNSISSMSEATATYSRESAESAGRLMQLSEVLREEMGRFKV